MIYISNIEYMVACRILPLGGCHFVLSHSTWHQNVQTLFFVTILLFTSLVRSWVPLRSYSAQYKVSHRQASEHLSSQIHTVQNWCMYYIGDTCYNPADFWLSQDEVFWYPHEACRSSPASWPHRHQSQHQVCVRGDYCSETTIAPRFYWCFVAQLVISVTSTSMYLVDAFITFVVQNLE